MLLMFKVKNYASFKNEAILDMRATAYVQHPSHVIPINDNLGLLKTSAIYGANASGKSNLISAMFFFERYIFSQFIDVKEDDSFDSLNYHAKVKLEPFLLSENNSEASEFDIIFIRNGKQIQYGFECTVTEVLSEWMFIDDKKVFERSGTELTFGSKYQKVLGAYRKLPAERLYIAVLGYFLERDSKAAVLSDFIDFFAEEYNVFSEILFESSIKGLAGSAYVSKDILDDSSFKQKVEHYLRLVDVGIIRLDIKTQTVVDEQTGKKIREKIVRTVHKVFDNNGKVIGEKYFDLRQESSGTLRFFTYIQNIIELINKGGVFIVDELSARLHPLFTKLIVDIFSSEQNKKAQLIFTTHDISLLNNSQFRRDEIVFIDKNERGESTLIALSDLKVREDASFSKDYLQGKYGAIPILEYNEIFGGRRDG